MLHGKQLNNTYQHTHHSILRMLMSLSRDSLSNKSIILDDSIVKRSKNSRGTTGQEIQAFNKMLNEGIDDSIKEDTAEESSRDDDLELDDLEKVGKTTKIEEEVIPAAPTSNTIKNFETRSTNYQTNIFFSPNSLYGGYPFHQSQNHQSVTNDHFERLLDSKRNDSLLIDSHLIGKKRDGSIVDTLEEEE